MAITEKYDVSGLSEEVSLDEEENEERTAEDEEESEEPVAAEEDSDVSEDEEEPDLVPVTETVTEEAEEARPEENETPTREEERDAEQTPAATAAGTAAKTESVVQDTVTMIDRNLSYSCDDDGQSLADYIAENTQTAAAMPNRYAELETWMTELLEQELDVYEIDGALFDQDAGEFLEFVDYYTALHCVFGNEKGTFTYGLIYQKTDEGKVLSKVILYVNNTRSSIEFAEKRWSIMVAEKAEQEQIAAENKKLIAKAVEAAGIKKGMTVEEAVTRINSYICKINTYDMSYMRRHFRDVLLEGTSVCNGYSELFMLMARYCGINCDLVVGIGNGESHDWNVVYFDNKELYVDSTWNDSSSGNPYLLITKEELLRDHTIQEYRKTLY